MRRVQEIQERVLNRQEQKKNKLKENTFASRNFSVISPQRTFSSFEFRIVQVRSFRGKGL